MNHRSGNQQVFRVSGASPQQLGTDLNANAEGATTPDNFMASDRVIQFQGEIYAVGTDGVYRFNQGPGNFPSTAPPGDWSNLTIDGALPFTNPATTVTGEMWKSGIHQVVIGNVPTLCGAYNTTSGSTSWRGYTFNGNTGVWNETADTVLAYIANPTTPNHRSFMYRNILYWLSQVAADLQVLTFDPGSATLGTFSTGGANAPRGAQASPCIFDDRLFLLSENTSTGAAGIYEFLAGTFTFLFEIAGTTATSIQEGKNCLFLDETGTSMIAMFLDEFGANDGWAAYEIDNIAGTITLGANITAAVIPSGIRKGVASLTGEQRFSVFYDQETTPGSYRTLLYHSVDGNAGTILTQYVWTNNATILLQEDAGGSAAWALPENLGPAGGGERIFTQGELHVEIVERLAILGGEAVRFKCYGDPGPVDKNVEFKRDADNEVPIAVATLIGTPTVVSGPGAAPTRNVNVLEGVEADDGATIYETTWDISTDGFVSGQRGQLVPRIFI